MRPSVLLALSISLTAACSTDGPAAGTDCVAAPDVCSAGQCCDTSSRSCKAAGSCGGFAGTCTPPVAIRQGDLSADITGISGDPEFKLKFRVSFAGQTAQLADLLVTTSAMHGAHVVQPYFARQSDAGPQPIYPTELSDVDALIAASSSAYLTPRTAYLDGITPGTQLAVCFGKLETIKPGVNPTCKNIGAFEPAVRSKLVYCAQTCHTGQGAAPAAFNMAPVLSTDPADVQVACVRALARADLDNPSGSLIVRQPKPAAVGGSAGHPYKIMDTTEMAAFESAVTTWLRGEK